MRLRIRICICILTGLYFRLDGVHIPPLVRLVYLEQEHGVLVLVDAVCDLFVRANYLGAGNCAVGACAGMGGACGGGGGCGGGGCGGGGCGGGGCGGVG